MRRRGIMVFLLSGMLFMGALLCPLGGVKGYAEEIANEDITDKDYVLTEENEMQIMECIISDDTRIVPGDDVDFDSSDSVQTEMRPGEMGMQEENEIAVEAEVQEETSEEVEISENETDAEILYQGQDGAISWQIDSNGTLYLTGDGDYNGDEQYSSSTWFPQWIINGRYKYIKYAVVNVTNITSTKRMFYYCQNMTGIEWNGFDTSKVTNMQGMFCMCESLETLDLSGFDTSNVTDMSGMFERCSKLKSLDVSNFDTSKVTTMRTLFYYCKKLQMLDVSNFDTSSVTNMLCLFGHCWELETLDVSGFDTSKVTTMDGLFTTVRNCRLWM